jgi:hypothetical protein
MKEQIHNSRRCWPLQPWEAGQIKNPGILTRCNFDKNLEMIQPLVQELVLATEPDQTNNLVCDWWWVVRYEDKLKWFVYMLCAVERKIAPHWINGLDVKLRADGLATSLIEVVRNDMIVIAHPDEQKNKFTYDNIPIFHLPFSDPDPNLNSRYCRHRFSQCLYMFHCRIWNHLTHI